MKSKYTKKDCIKAMKDFYEKNGYIPTIVEWDNLGLLPKYPIFLKTIRWNKCLKLCGLEVKKTGFPKGKIKYSTKSRGYKRPKVLQEEMDEIERLRKERTY